MFKVKRDQIIGIALVILGIIIFAMIQGYSMPFSATYPGPKALPGLAAFGFVVCGAGIFFQSTVDRREQKTFLVKEGWIRVAVVFGLLILYVLLMKFLGFIIVTPVICFIFATLFARGTRCSVRNRIIFSVIFTLFIYFLYTKAFSLPMPEPFWV